MLATIAPFQQYFDSDGSPLDSGYLYFGVENLNPETSPIAVYWDAAGTQPAAQPIRTLNGYPLRNGSPSLIFAAGGYSVTVKSKTGVTIVYSPTPADFISQLTNTTDATKGSALIGYKLNATGSVGRSVSSRLAEWISVKDFGATGDGTTDDTAAIQAAVNFAAPLGRTIFFPKGSYVYSGISVSAGQSCSFIGESTASVYLLLSSGTATGFNCATDLPVAFEDLTFAYKASITGSAGAFISIPANTAGNYNSRFRRLQMNAPWIGIATSGAASWVADTVSIGEYISAAITVQNTFQPDHGDSSIINCTFTTSVATAIGILQRSSGGLRIVNNKIIGGAYYYQLILDTGVNTSDLMVVGNSMEGSVTAGLEFRRNTASGSFANITITANQFAGGPNVIHFDEPTAGWLQNIAVTSNAITVQGGTAITVNAAANFSLIGNAIRGVIGTEVGIAVAAAATSGTIGGNNLSNLAALAINNLSATTACIKRVLSGTTGTITCSTAVGSVFSGTGSISFPAGYFGQVPRIHLTVNGGANGMCGSYSSPSTSGANILGFAATTGANVAFNWTAEADY